MEARTYLAVDLKSFYASVECVERRLDPMTTNLVVADLTRTEKTICLAVTPSTAWSWLFAPTLKYFLRFFASIKTFSSIVISSRLRCWTAADQTGSSG